MSHTVNQKEGLWRIADTYYHSGYLWPHLFRINQKNIFNPDLLPIGLKIWIPVFEQNRSSFSDKDRHELAESFLFTYFYYKEQNYSKAHHFLWVADQLGGSDFIQNYQTSVHDSDLARIASMKGRLKLN